jgi:DNA-binding LacI/PurR family transcriptional regulator/DNA-binding transcriptional regulator YhcF (GntR family)
MILPETLKQPIGRQQLFLALQERIEQGHYAPGSWLPAERALAAEFSLDRSAVRSALAQLEEGGLIVRETGKRPWVRTGQASPRQTRSGFKTFSGSQKSTGMQTIAAILPQHPVFPASLALMHGINTALRSAEAPFRVQVMDTHGTTALRATSLERQALDSVLREEIAGVLLWHLGGEETLPQLREIERHDIPIVFVDRFPPELACDFVGGDNHAGIEAAIDYLRGMGHQRIAYLSAEETATAVTERLAAYQEIMQANGLPLCPQWIGKVPQDNTAHVAPIFDQFFSLPNPPTAVVALNDSLAYYFMEECARRGKRTPEDISVIGFDDLEAHSPRPPILTTLHQPFDKMGRRAAEILLRRLSEPDARQEPRRHILLPTPLVVRSTCRPL